MTTTMERFQEHTELIDDYGERADFLHAIGHDRYSQMQDALTLQANKRVELEPNDREILAEIVRHTVKFEAA